MIISQDTTWSSGSDYHLTEFVQVAHGATLTIEGGVSIYGGSIISYGNVYFAGAVDNLVEINDVEISFGVSNFDTPGYIQFDFVQMKGGSFLDASGHGSYGYFNVKNSSFSNVDGFYIWYPTEESTFVGNAFINSRGLSIGSAVPIIVDGNTFLNSTRPWNGSVDSSILNWASLGEPLKVVENNFYNSSGVSLELPIGYSSVGAVFVDNYSVASTYLEAQNNVLDKLDDLGRGGYIDTSRFSLLPNYNAPAVQVLFSGSDSDNIVSGLSFSDRLWGAGGDDSISGVGGNDRLFGNMGDDTLLGGRGADRLDGGAGDDKLVGGAGVDTAIFSGKGAIQVTLANSGVQDTGQGRDILMGIENIVSGNGRDSLWGNAAANVLNGNGGKDQLYGNGGNDRLLGGNGADQLRGGSGEDRLLGGRGNDTLLGGNGSDRLEGALGRDILTGGRGADVFVFVALADSGTARGADRITDFRAGQGDKIDLSGLDGNSNLAGKQALSFIGSDEFSAAGQLRFVQGWLSADTDGDGLADFEIAIDAGATIAAQHLIL